MTDRPKSEKKRSWIAKYAGSKDSNVSSTSSLPVPQEGRELSYDHPLSRQTSNISTTTATAGASASNTPGDSGLPSRSSSTTSISSGPPTRPTTPSKRYPSTSLTKDEYDQQASRIIQHALERTNSSQQGSKTSLDKDGKGSFSRRSLTSMMGGLSSLSLGSRRDEDSRERGRSVKKEKDKGKARSSSYSGSLGDDGGDSGSWRARSQSPFHLRRTRTRDTSPTVEALSQSDVESDAEVARIRPRNAFSLGGDDESPDDDDDDEEEDSDEELWSEEDDLDPVTSRNTERNALIPADMVETDTTDIPDPLGEGVNVVIAPEPYFPTTLMNPSSSRNPRRRKSTRHDTLHLDTSRPVFQRDRCTITLTQGDPQGALEHSGRRPKRYVLASDLSEESRYALEWGIGTVLRDGDEMLIVTVVENEAKVDPLIAPADRHAKLRSQQERQAMAYILVRQATSLLQRTRLNVTIACQAWHAKNARHMLLDIVDYVEPTMVIVGSRGLGNLKGILLGSTSHYLIQKCSVPVMVARRRLKRPPRRSAHLATHRARVSLAQAGIDRVASKVDQDVAQMREQVERDDHEHEHEHEQHEAIEDDDDIDTEVEGEPGSSPLGRKVPGE
ncbi:hypothetical protein C8Q75DRAFT_769337 [Abortiporus biennis]|nr:hypothetical protein C8Q75DRAFT_769337 [Abortiporus biennis]